MIAESYERIHRSNLVGMGIIPLQYMLGQNAESLGLTGKEKYSITIPEDPRTGQTLKVEVSAFIFQMNIIDLSMHFVLELSLTVLSDSGY